MSNSVYNSTWDFRFQNEYEWVNELKEPWQCNSTQKEHKWRQTINPPGISRPEKDQRPRLTHSRKYEKTSTRGDILQTNV